MLGWALVLGQIPAANSPGVPWFKASGQALDGWPGAFLLLLVQPVDLAAQLVKVLGLGYKPVDRFELDL